jgi:chorismate mutase
LFVSVRVLPRGNDFHPFNKLMRCIRILLHVNQKNFKNFF